MTVLSLYMMSFPIGIAAIFFAYRASIEGIGRGERTILLASSLGLVLSICLILLLMLTTL